MHVESATWSAFLDTEVIDVHHQTYQNLRRSHHQGEPLGPILVASVYLQLAEERDARDEAI